MALDGMGMMLKSMGINPDEIKASIENFKSLATTVAETQKRIDAQLSTLLISNARIEGKLDELLSRSAEVESKEEMAQHFAEAGAPLEVREDGNSTDSNRN